MDKYVLAIDVGSTTTKAILFGPKENSLRLIDWTGAPTTVEKPHEDVLVGVRNAVQVLEKKTNRKLLNNRNIIKPAKENIGVDFFVSTSSAGGGLQMLVTGVIKKMTAESAEKAALGAGAIVSQVLAIDDGKTDLERLQTIQRLRPDMVLISGGIDGGNDLHVTSMAELISLANPESRLGDRFILPVVYAGNKEARGKVESFLSDVADVHHVENIRPVLERENLEPAGEKIQDLFLEHVMSHAPGYDKLIDLTENNIMPTPNAVGDLVKLIGEDNDINILAVDIGGATTDVFSSLVLAEQKRDDDYLERDMNTIMINPLDIDIRRRYHRSVDANLGMSYSIGNVLAETGGDNIARWLPFAADEAQLRDILSNKMIHPTILPQTKKALLIEHAVAREAIRLAVLRHKSIASGLSGVQTKRSIEEVFNQVGTGGTLIKDIDIDVIIGSGGVLSHTPDRKQALAIMLDAFEPQGVTELYVDSIFMMPHLGVMSSIMKENIFEILKKDCLIPLGTVIAPNGPAAKDGQELATLVIEFKDGRKVEESIIAGQLKSLPLDTGEEAIVEIKPAYNYDFGEGSGKMVKSLLTGGTGGIIIDGRGRPIKFEKDSLKRSKQLKSWLHTLEAYPDNYMEV
ncbi:MAG: glutamate mutase L [Clostridia bacterium]